VDVRLEVFEEMGHVFQLLYAPLPEAVAARRHGARFLDNHLSA
jgi:acetyl esterase/lipase